MNLRHPLVLASGMQHELLTYFGFIQIRVLPVDGDIGLAVFRVYELKMVQVGEGI